MADLYETVVIVDAMIPDEAISSEFEAIEKQITSRGKLLKTDVWGRRKLSYQIKGRSYGDYGVFYYQADSKLPSELEKGFRINENILRWMTVADNPAGVPADKAEPEQAEAIEVKPEAKKEEKSEKETVE
ncbi:MAG: 30S ribosomal protein S6 [Fibrobacteria bacterium]|nr:30S ribosomal protein S6 [Fibrobacteria bacterium]